MKYLIIFFGMIVSFSASAGDRLPNPSEKFINELVPDKGLWLSQGESVVYGFSLIPQEGIKKLKLVGYVGISSTSAYRAGTDYARFTVDLEEYTDGEWSGWMGGHGFILVDFPGAKLTCRTPIAIVLRSDDKDSAHTRRYILKAWTPKSIAVKISRSKCPSDPNLNDLTESWPMTYFQYQ